MAPVHESTWDFAAPEKITCNVADLDVLSFNEVTVSNRETVIKDELKFKTWEPELIEMFDKFVGDLIYWLKETHNLPNVGLYCAVKATKSLGFLLSLILPWIALTKDPVESTSTTLSLSVSANIICLFDVMTYASLGFSKPFLTLWSNAWTGVV